MREWWRRLFGYPASGNPKSAGPQPKAGAHARSDRDENVEGGPDIQGRRVTRDAEWADVEIVTALLEAANVDYVLIGGYALVVNGIVRQTGDIDVVVRNTPENNVRWIEALSHLPDGAAAELRGETMPFPVSDELGDDEPGVLRIFDEFVVDVMPRACGLSYEDLEPHIGEIEEGGRRIKVLELEGLLLTKRGMRGKDVVDREQIVIALSRSRSRAPQKAAGRSDVLPTRPIPEAKNQSEQAEIPASKEIADDRAGDGAAVQGPKSPGPR